MQNAKEGQKVTLSAAVTQGLACAVEGQRNATAFAVSGTPCSGLRNATAFAPSKDADAGEGALFAGYGAWLLTVRGE